MMGHGGAPQWPNVAPNPLDPQHGVQGETVDSGVNVPDGTTEKGAASGTPKGPSRVIFAHETLLRYGAGAEKPGDGTTRLDAYRGTRSAGEFFELNPGPAAVARGNLGGT